MRIAGKVKKNVTKNKLICIMCGKMKHLVEIKCGSKGLSEEGVRKGFYANRCVRCYNRFCMRWKLGLSSADIYGGNIKNDLLVAQNTKEEKAE